MAAILNEIIAIGGTTAFEEPVTEENMIDWYVTSKALYCCHVAVDENNALAGFQALEQTDAYGPGIGEISSFARQSSPVSGTGKLLFAETRIAAARLGLKAINAKIRTDNQPGLRYYTKMGFQDHSVIADVPLKDGTPVDRVLKRFQIA
ncbi:MAG: GNAT family N-acetyltransferase [Silicimonas sp.]|nr:GNAT family N-acetyltransferase [Silicimonas sp.]